VCSSDLPGHRWFGGDVSPEALLATRENSAAAAPGEALDLRLGDLFAPFRDEAPFDLVVSNPPYVADDEWAGLAREVREHDPAVALRSGADPVSFLRRIASEGVPLCAGKARIALEGGSGLPAFLAEAQSRFPDAAWSLRHDLAGLPRVVVADLS
jgi:release factor glutamine methyltransferase